MVCIFKGTNGKDGADGGVGQPGAAVWNLCITNLFVLITFKGPPGPSGQSGPSGTPGIPVSCRLQ